MILGLYMIMIMIDHMQHYWSVISFSPRFLSNWEIEMERNCIYY